MKNIIDFYLKTVLPTAIADMTEENKNYKPHIESIQLIFDQLKNDMIKCVSCQIKLIKNQADYLS